MLSELHHSHQSFILIILFVIVVHKILIILINVRKLQYAICQGTCCYSTYPYQHNCHGFKAMIPRVTQVSMLPKLPHKTRPHATNEPPKTSTNRLLSPLPTRVVCTHTTVGGLCRPASILHMEQSAESVEAVEDWTISPSVSRYLRDASHWSCLHSQPQVGMLTMHITNQSISVFCFDQKFTRYKKLYLTLVSDKHEH